MDVPVLLEGGEQAGVPGSGPWKLTYGQYGDPPFRQYTVGNRPPNAAQMCSLVANPNQAAACDGSPSGMTELSWLSASNNQIEDVAPLAGLDVQDTGPGASVQTSVTFTGLLVSVTA